MKSLPQSQTFRDLHVEGHGHSVMVLQISSDAAASGVTAAFSPASPYMGLDHFREEQKDLFFGREDLIAELLAAVASSNLTMVSGASGSGKSSVVRAGLIPAMRKRLTSARLRTVTLTPDRDPFISFTAALLSSGCKQDQLPAVKGVDKQTIPRLFKQLRAPGDLWLLFVDQFEQIFAPNTDKAQRSAFLDGLVALAEESQNEVRIVLAMRADFIDRFDQYPRLANLAQANLRLVTSPQTAVLQQCIEKPAARHGVCFERGLVDLILNEVRDQPGTLPLLQYMLDRLWRISNLDKDRTLKLTDYRRLDGVRGTLKKRADELFLYQDPVQAIERSEEQKGVMRRVFLRLVNLSDQSENAHAFSRRVTQSEFTKQDEQQIIEQLVTEKLLVTNRLLSDAVTVEVAHESLLSAWPQLQIWINERRSVLFVGNLLKADAKSWGKVRHNVALAEPELWSGSRLQQALDLRASQSFDLVHGLLPLEDEFLEASREKNERQAEERRLQAENLKRKNRNLSFALFGLGSLLVLALVMTMRALRAERAADGNQREAQRQLAVATAISARSLTEHLSPTALLMGIKAATVSGASNGPLEPDAKWALATVGLTAGYPLVPELRHAGDVILAAYGPDERTILTASEDGTLRLYDAREGEQLLMFRGHKDPVIAAALSPPAGRWLVAASRDGQLRLYDTSRSDVHSTLSHEDVRQLAFSHSGRWLISGAMDGTTKLWDVATWHDLRTLDGRQSMVSAVLFSPDDSLVAIAAQDGSLRLWDPRTGTARALIPDGEGFLASYVSSITYSADSQRLIAGYDDGIVRVWDTHDGSLLDKTMVAQRRIVRLAMAKDGSLLTVDSLGARIWQGLGTKGHKRETPLKTFFVPSREGAAVLSGDGKLLIVARNSGLAQFDMDSLLLRSEFRIGSGQFKDLSLSSRGDRVLAIGINNTVKVYATNPGADPEPIDAKQPVCAARYAPTGRALLLRTGKGPGCSRSGRLKYFAPGQSQPSWESSSRLSAFSRDGYRLLLVRENNVAVVDVASGDTKLSVEVPAEVAGWAQALAWSPDEQHLFLVTKDRHVYRLELSTGLLIDCTDKSPVADSYGTVATAAAAAFYPLADHPDLVVIANGSGEATPWDGRSCQPRLGSAFAHGGIINRIVFSPSGDLLLTVGLDLRSQFWNPKQPEKSLFLGTQFTADEVRFATADQFLLTTTREGRLRLWRPKEEQEVFAFAVPNQRGHWTPITPSSTSATPVWTPFSTETSLTDGMDRADADEISMDLSEDGEELVVGRLSGGFQRISLDLKDLLTLACRKLRHHRDEWKQVESICHSTAPTPFPSGQDAF